MSETGPKERADALEFLKELAAAVSRGTVELPCFSNVVVRISEALIDPDTTAEQVVTIVGAEPNLAGRLLQTANSAAFHGRGGPVNDLRAAVTRLGLQTVQTIAISIAIKQMQYEDSLQTIAGPLARLWSRSVAAACVCQLLAERTTIPPDTAFLAGLLHGIGALYIMANVAARTPDPEEHRSRLELLGGWQASIGKTVLENWGFAEDLCEAVENQHDRDRRWQNEPALTDVLIAALLLVEALEMPEPRSIATGAGVFASLGLSPVDCQATIARAERRIALVHDALK